MSKNEKIYQSIFLQLSILPPDNLQEVDVYLQNLVQKIKKKEQRRARILSLAGGWNDMPESEFQDFLSITKTIGNEMFKSNVEFTQLEIYAKIC
jgi:hypothetical protein